MAISTLVIATRTSKLALTQTNIVKQALLQHYPWLKIDTIAIKTTGDKILDTDLTKIGGKGLFVKELEEQILCGNADIAVHSMKDVPAQLPMQLLTQPQVPAETPLILAAILPRANPYDVLASSCGFSLDDLPRSATVGSSSLRRQAQLLTLRPDLKIKLLRGNVDTRINKLYAKEYDAIILAKAGIERLQITDLPMQQLSPSQMLPAVGQGAIGIECRKNASDVLKLLAALNDPITAICVHAERSMNACLNGSCSTPIAGFAELCTTGISPFIATTLQLTGIVAQPDGKKILRVFKQVEINLISPYLPLVSTKLKAPTSEDTVDDAEYLVLLKQAEVLGKQVAKELIEQGADNILKCAN